MRAALFLLALVSIASGSPSAAATDPSIAQNLGSILGSEEFCGLSYDQSAIERFVEKHVAADDMGFASMLNIMTAGAKYQNQAMSPSEKTAHCTQIRRAAASFGFIK